MWGELVFLRVGGGRWARWWWSGEVVFIWRDSSAVERKWWCGEVVVGVGFCGEVMFWLESKWMQCGGVGLVLGVYCSEPI